MADKIKTGVKIFSQKRLKSEAKAIWDGKFNEGVAFGGLKASDFRGSDGWVQRFLK